MLETYEEAYQRAATSQGLDVVLLKKWAEGVDRD